MKLKEGMYVRTKHGTFDRLVCKQKSTEANYIWYRFEERGAITNPENYIVKASNNIIDLLEVGDYVNGYRVELFDKENEKIICSLMSFKYDEIKSIVTKEMFANAEYRVETD